MSEPLSLLVCSMAGCALGLFFFGGLWWTVRKVAESRRPALLMVSSYFLRVTLVVLALLFVVAGGHWGRLFACLFGFLGARILITRWVRRMALAVPSNLEVTANATESR